MAMGRPEADLPVFFRLFAISPITPRRSTQMAAPALSKALTFITPGLEVPSIPMPVQTGSFSQISPRL